MDEGSLNYNLNRKFVDHNWVVQVKRIFPKILRMQMQNIKTRSYIMLVQEQNMCY